MGFLTPFIAKAVNASPREILGTGARRREVSMIPLVMQALVEERDRDLARDGCPRPHRPRRRPLDRRLAAALWIVVGIGLRHLA